MNGAADVGPHERCLHHEDGEPRDGEALDPAKAGTDGGRSQLHGEGDDPDHRGAPDPAMDPLYRDPVVLDDERDRA